jgi:cyclopropane fatty-acyl-phospholipid synthase-like methyltransferase
MASARERDVAECFAKRYEAVQPEVAGDIEIEVLGGDLGANGYTTITQADRLAQEVALGPGARLLDLGAGRGWPGLYLAATTGCQVVLVDVPLAGLEAAMQRAEREGLSRRAVAVVASARSLPFSPTSFDSIVHTDVMCCVRPKVTILRACLRLLRPGGRTAFYTIQSARGLSDSKRRRASRDGPTFVVSTRSNYEMLEAAGFTDVREADCTEEFATVQRKWIEQRDRHHAEMAAALGEAAFEERQSGGRAQLRAIEDGILLRSLLTARRPGEARSVDAAGQSAR